MKHLWVFYSVCAVVYFIVGIYYFLTGGSWFMWIILGLSPMSLFAVMSYRDEQKKKELGAKNHTHSVRNSEDFNDSQGGAAEKQLKQHPCEERISCNKTNTKENKQ